MFDLIPWALFGILAVVVIILLYKIKSMVSTMKKLSQEVALKNSEGYDKFVVESREWAFDYIEQVQTSLQELVEASEKIDQTVKKLLPNK